MFKKIISFFCVFIFGTNLVYAEINNEVINDFFSDTVFIGDSIVGDYNIFSSTKDAGPAKNALYLGAKSYSISRALDTEDTKNHPIYRGLSETPDQVIPKTGKNRVFISIGGNDVGSVGLDPTMAKYDKLIKKIYEKKPDAKIYIIGLTYITKDGEDTYFNNKNYRIFNARLKELCCRWNATYINIGDRLTDSKGNLREDLSYDNQMHMKLDTYKIWNEIISDVFKAEIN